MEDERQDVQAQTQEVTPSIPPAPHPLADWLDEENAGFKAFQRGAVVEGNIVSITESELLLDIGAKSEGVVPVRDLDLLDPEFRQTLKVGEHVLATVVRPQTQSGHIILSLTRAEMEKDWREAERLQKSQEIFQAPVAGHNKGGLIAKLGKLRGFIPASQLASEHQRSGEGEETWAKMDGQDLQLKVIELDRRRNRLILSERAALREWREEQKDRLLESLHEGDVRKGTVTSLCEFGAFVDLGGADGLIHISEMAWGRINHPSEVLNVGQSVDVHILSVDRGRKRIGLSLKRLMPEPWDLVEQNYKVGQLVEGTITKLTPFGAFARIDESIEGLVHISELSDGRIAHPKEVVKEGEAHTLRIIRIDSQKRRMGLSLKRVADPQYADIDWREEYAASLQDEGEWEESEGEAEAQEQKEEPEAAADAEEQKAQESEAEAQEQEEAEKQEEPEAATEAQEQEEAEEQEEEATVTDEQLEACLSDAEKVDESDAPVAEAPSETD